MKTVLSIPAKYRIKSAKFNLPEGLLPTGDAAQACTQVALVLTNAETPQLLMRFWSTEYVRSLLVQHVHAKATE
jgi:hypothetical protein